jgi:hypothetical protein
MASKIAVARELIVWKPVMPGRSRGSYESLLRITWIQAMPGGSITYQ